MKNPSLIKEDDRIIVYGLNSNQKNLITIKVFNKELDLISVTSFSIKHRFQSVLSLKRVKNYYCLSVSNLKYLNKYFLDFNFQVVSNEEINVFKSDLNHNIDKHVVNRNPMFVDPINQEMFEMISTGVEDQKRINTLYCYAIRDSIGSSEKKINWEYKIPFHDQIKSKICSFDSKFLYVLIHSNYNEFLFCFAKKTGELIYKTEINTGQLKTTLCSKVEKIDDEIILFGSFFDDKHKLEKEICSGYFCALIDKKGGVLKVKKQDFFTAITNKSEITSVEQKEKKIALCNFITKSNSGYHFLVSNYVVNNDDDYHFWFEYSTSGMKVNQYDENNNTINSIQNYEVVHLDNHFQSINSITFPQKTLVHSFFNYSLKEHFSVYDEYIINPNRVGLDYANYYDFSYSMRGSGNFFWCNREMSKVIYLSSANSFSHPFNKNLALIKVSLPSTLGNSNFTWLYLIKHFYLGKKDELYKAFFKPLKNEDILYGIKKVKQKYYLEMIDFNSF